jgi:4-aminobutyrate aminotransferase/(S)-3-amino-2-methylpropionate transaminase
LSPQTGRELPHIRVAPPGPRSRAIAQRVAAVESPAFEARRQAREATSHADQSAIAYEHGVGANLYDADGNRYVDLVAGFGALALGHANAAISRAVASQMERLPLALGDVYATQIKLDLCERIAALYPEPDARVMLGLSGADAVTAALKTAVLATGKAGVVAFSGSYHGLSYAPLAACGLAEAFRTPFAAQLGEHVRFAPYPAGDSALGASLDSVRGALEVGDVGAVLVEPVLGRGGCVVPPAAFLPELRALCDRHRALLIADEIWTGLGRSGAWLASVASGVRPDLVCLGKALGGGLPVSACVGSDAVMRAWGKHGGTAIHTATHFGWPVACAAAMATLDVLEREQLPARAAEVGARFIAALRQAGFDARGRGLMVGVVLADASAALGVSRRLLGEGWLVLTGGSQGNVLTLTPPLDIDAALLDAFTQRLAAAVHPER